MSDDSPLMYTSLAPWFHLLTPPADYEDFAALTVATFTELAQRPVQTVLELGSGGGNTASHLKAHYTMTLTDLSGDMLALSQTINPECEHLTGDMRTLRLGRTFDAVLIYDAISYMTTEDDLLSALITAREHLAPGGVAFFAPDETTESYRPGSETGGNDGDERAMRYLMWSDMPSDGTYTTTFAYIVRDAGGVRVEHETHTFGLFSHDTWMDLIRRAGLRPERRTLPHYSHPETEQFLFAGVRPGGQGDAPLG